MASQPFVGRRVWEQGGLWSVRFRTHGRGYATVVTRARSREQAERIADVLEARERRARVLLLAAAGRLAR